MDKKNVGDMESGYQLVDQGIMRAGVHTNLNEPALSILATRKSDEASFTASTEIALRGEDVGNARKHFQRDKTSENNEAQVSSLKLKCDEVNRASLEKPTRPRTAYNYFLRDERAKILDEYEEKAKSETESSPSKKKGFKKSKKPHISFEDIGKIIGKRWKELDENAKEHYLALAREDSKRYKAEMETYHAQVCSEAIKRREDDISEPLASANSTIKDTNLRSFEVNEVPSKRRRMWIDQNPGRASLSSLQNSLLGASSSNMLEQIARSNVEQPALPRHFDINHPFCDPSMSLNLQQSLLMNNLMERERMIISQRVDSQSSWLPSMQGYIWPQRQFLPALNNMSGIRQEARLLDWNLSPTLASEDYRRLLSSVDSFRNMQSINPLLNANTLNLARSLDQTGDFVPSSGASSTVLTPEKVRALAIERLRQLTRQTEDSSPMGEQNR